MGNIFLYNLPDYGNEYIEKISTKEQLVRNSLSVIDASVNEKIILRHDFELSEDWKGLNSLKNTRRNDTTLITNATDSKNDREIDIDELSILVTM